MLSINTNLSSLIAQNSMSSATKLLNQAVERMTTGYKINHAKDNAANYSISQNMNMQISSFDVAADNVAMGMDLVTTASDIISNMQDKASRLQALCTQARNGTYGAQSMQAINSEAAAIMAEINRLYNTAEYNNVSLFNRKAYELTPEHQALTETLNSEVKAKAEYNGFIEDPKTYTDAEVAAMTKVADVSTFTSGEKYSISSVEELQKLADYVNAGNDTTGVEFVLGADIDLSSISNWTSIGYDFDHTFKGSFDGNGHIIKNLKIDSTEVYRGLFGYSDGEIKNVGIAGGSVKGSQYIGGLAGSSYGSITNCYATCNITATSNNAGGLIGYSTGSITNCYATGNINGTVSVGGLAGSASSITNCYATGNVISKRTTRGSVGGLAGSSTGSITNCYATGNVSGGKNSGGLIGSSNDSITNCYATGNVSGGYIGGLAGSAKGSITNCYTTGNVDGINFTGGVVGIASLHLGSDLEIKNSTSYSQSVTGQEATGSILGCWSGENLDGSSSGNITIENCSALSSLQGVGSYCKYDEDNSTYIIDSSYDLSACNSAVTQILAKPVQTTLQVGINSDSSNQISFDTNFELNFDSLGDLTSDEALASIMSFQALLSDKATALGAVENRLQSAIESIEVNIENLTSSLSTIRDADIAEVSSEYIRQQILQQASATLLSTANQSPSIALQLI